MQRNIQQFPSGPILQPRRPRRLLDPDGSAGYHLGMLVPAVVSSRRRWGAYLRRTSLVAKLLAAVVLSMPLACASSNSSGGGPVACNGALPPECGQPCTSECGCIFCAPGAQECRTVGGVAEVATCRADGTCYELTSCPSGGGCLQTGTAAAVCVSTVADCPLVKDAYEKTTATAALVERADGTVLQKDAGSCFGAANCGVFEGHCTIGLGDCWYVGVDTQPSELDRLAALYENLGCSVAQSCACTSTPAAATCDRLGKPGPGVCRPAQ